MARAQVVVSTEQCASGGQSIALWDLATGNMLSTYHYRNHGSNQSGWVARHCVERIGWHSMIAAYHNSPLLYVYGLETRDRVHHKMVMPGAVSSLAITPDDNYALLAIGPKVHIYQLASGNLLNTVEKHYQAVSVIRVTSDQSYFVTGGNDGHVLVWSLSKLLVPSQSFHIVGASSNLFDPIHSIVHSNSKVSDIHLGLGGIHAKMVVSSEDLIVKIYELQNCTLLATISLPSMIHCVIMDRSERSLYCGAHDGRIFETGLNLVAYHQPECSSQAIYLEQHTEEAAVNNRTPVFEGHTGMVTALAVSIDGQALLSGSADHCIKVWHVESGQCMRTLTAKGVITNLLVYPALAGLFFADSLQSKQLWSHSGTSGYSHDPSLKGLGRKRDHSSDSQWDSLYGTRAVSLDVLRSVENPPKPVVPFARELYRPTLTFTTTTQTSGTTRHESNSTKLDAFSCGFLMIHNADNETSGPWLRHSRPYEEELERIFQQSQQDFEWLQYNQTKTKSIGKRNGKSAKWNRRNGTIADGDQMPQMIELDVDDTVEINDGFKDKESGSDKLQAKFQKLRTANNQLYQLAVDHLFGTMFTSKTDISSSSTRHNQAEQPQVIELDP